MFFKRPIWDTTKVLKLYFFIFRLYDRVNNRDIQILNFFQVRDDNIEMSQEKGRFESGRSESGRSESGRAKS